MDALVARSNASATTSTQYSGDHSVSVPPDPISNSEVKRVRADDSVGSPHVKVGHRRVYLKEEAILNGVAFFCLEFGKASYKTPPCGDFGFGRLFRRRF